MKRILILLAAVVVTLGAAAQSRIGTVNRSAVLHALPEYSKAQTELQQLADAYQQEYAAMQRDFNNKYAEFQDLSNSDTPATIRERRIKELQEMDNKLKEFRRRSEDDLRLRRDALTAPLQQTVSGAIAAVAEEQGLDLVLDVSDHPVAYAGKAVVDITDAVNTSLK